MAELDTIDPQDLQKLSISEPTAAISAVFEILMFVFDKPANQIKKWEKQRLLAVNPETLIADLKGYDFENIHYKLLDKVKLRIDYYLGKNHKSGKWENENAVVQALGTYLIRWHQMN